MPIFHLACRDCDKRSRRILAKAGAIDALLCECGGKLRREATGPALKVVEVLDNGLMPRALERLADAERLRDEKVRGADPLAGQSRRQ